MSEVSSSIGPARDSVSGQFVSGIPKPSLAGRVLTMKQELTVRSYDMMPDDAFLETRSVAVICSLGVSTIWKYIGLGKFPRGIKLANNRTVWTKKAIREWLEARHAGVPA
jgi:predicted DNA-binding transcriptional regulator AlpA